MEKTLESLLWRQSLPTQPAIFYNAMGHKAGLAAKLTQGWAGHSFVALLPLLHAKLLSCPRNSTSFLLRAQPGLKDVGFCRALTILAQTRTKTTPCKVFLVWCFYLPFLIVAFHSWQQSKLNRKSFCRPLRATNSSNTKLY